MSEDSTTHPDTPVEAAQLRLQAESLRKSQSLPLRNEDYSALKKLVLLALIFVAVAGSAYLLIDGALRRNLIIRAADGWNKYVSNSSAEGVFKIPPPPPRQVDPRVVYPAGVATLGGGVETTGGTIYQSGESPEDTVEKTYVPPPKTPESGTAYSLLRAKSAVAGKLAAGELEAWRFKEWKPVQSKPPVYYVDLVAVRVADSTEVHFVWSVDVQSQKVSPLSQAARDLEAGR